MSFRAPLQNAARMGSVAGRDAGLLQTTRSAKRFRRSSEKRNHSRWVSRESADNANTQLLVIAAMNRLTFSLFCALGFATSLAQADIRETFTGVAAPGWTISDNSALTAPSIDLAGSGWLRLNPLANNQTGRTLLTDANEYVPAGLPIYLEFEYVSWGGGTEHWSADGLTVYLYDAAKDMAGALYGGSLSYCGGSGAYLAVGLDEWGNFSGPYAAATGCSWSSSADQQRNLDTVVIRGPQSASFPNLAAAPYSAGIDFATAASRPVPTKVQITMTT